MKQKTELTDKQAKQQERLSEIIQQIKVHEEKIKLLETKQNTEKCGRIVVMRSYSFNRR